MAFGSECWWNFCISVGRFGWLELTENLVEKFFPSSKSPTVPSNWRWCQIGIFWGNIKGRSWGARKCEEDSLVVPKNGNWLCVAGNRTLLECCKIFVGWDGKHLNFLLVNKWFNSELVSDVCSSKCTFGFAELVNMLVSLFGAVFEINCQSGCLIRPALT